MTTPSSKSKAKKTPGKSTKAPNPIHDLIWGLLNHMLGRQDECDKKLRRIIKKVKKNDNGKRGELNDLDKTINNLIATILAYQEFQKIIGIETKGNRYQSIVEKTEKGLAGKEYFDDHPFRLLDHLEIASDILDEKELLVHYPLKLRRSLVKSLGRFIHPVIPEIPKIWKECERIEDGVRGKADDSPENGFSRDPFKEIERMDPGDSCDHHTILALAAICYLLRGYAIFFSQPSSKRDSNLAKIALNDIHQSFQLTWRLYNSLPCSHLKPGKTFDDYLMEVQKGEEPGSHPGRSPYYIWNIIQLCRIQRGNIYRKIDYIEVASDNYRRMKKRFDQLLSLSKIPQEKLIDPSNSDFVKNFITPTYIKALLEFSKVEYDRGFHLKALLIQTTCLRLCLYVSRFSAETLSDTGSLLPLILKIISIEKHLNTEKGYSVVDKEIIARYFGNEADDDEEVKIPEGITPFIYTSEIANLISEICGRMGFILYELRPRSIPRFKKDKAIPDPIPHDWIIPYFIIDEKWNIRVNIEGVKKVIKVKRPSISQYCLTLFDKQENDPDHSKESEERKGVKSTFMGQIEREFSHLIRKKTEGIEPDTKPEIEPEVEFYKKILEKTTENIGNILTIPSSNNRVIMRRGYKFCRGAGLLSKDRLDIGLEKAVNEPQIEKSEVPNKFVVLRKCQSLNPIYPRHGRITVKGGGYFLLWKGKGIVIDPGFDFISNFYGEGFSLEDIDAIVVTHAHPDHDGDFTNLTSLVYKWNEYHRKIGPRGQNNELIKKLDLFLSGSIHWKFSSWLQANGIEYGRVIELPVIAWNRDSKDDFIGPRRGKHVTIDLRPYNEDETSGKNSKFYDMMIEVIPAWHNDLISKTSAVGLKFYLFKENDRSDDKKKAACILGYTSDTRAYGLSTFDRKHVSNDPKHTDDRKLKIDELYCDCDVLVAHLGDIRIREITTILDSVRGDTKVEPLLPIVEICMDWFRETPLNQLRDRIKEYIHFLLTFNLVEPGIFDFEFNKKGIDSSLLREEIERFYDQLNSIDQDPDAMNESLSPDILLKMIKESHPATKPALQSIKLSEWLQQFFDSLTGEIDSIDIDFNSVVRKNCPSYLLNEKMDKWRSKTKSLFIEMRDRLKNELIDKYHKNYCGISESHISQVVYVLAKITLSALNNFQYKDHLGIFGIFNLYKQMLLHAPFNNRKQDHPIFIVGELPEELTSYRHQIANQLNWYRSKDERKKKEVYAFTADNGLHVKLDKQPEIRCTYCSYNNEINCHKGDYHHPQYIVETPIKRNQGSLIYLCTTYDHQTEDVEKPRHFLMPELRST